MNAPEAPNEPLAEDAALVRRLRALDLRWPSVGEHLEAERFPELAAGVPPTEAEARHLAGCAACAELWVAVAADLAELAELTELTELADLAPAAEDRPSPPRRGPTRTRRRWLAAALVLGGAAAAALGLEALRPRPEPSPTPALPASPGAPVSPPIRKADALLPAPAAAETIAEAGLAEDAIEGAPGPAPVAEGVVTAADGVTAAADGVKAGADAPAAAADAVAAAADAVAAAAEEGAPAGDGGTTPSAPVGFGPRGGEEAPEGSRPPTMSTAPPRTSPRFPATAALAPRLAPPPAPRAPERLAVDGPPRGDGFLRLNTRPAARVFVDGRPQGWTPIIDLRLPEGPHDVRLEYDPALAEQPEERFRIVIEPDGVWRALRDNRRRHPAEVARPQR